MDVALKIWRFDPESGERELTRLRGGGARVGLPARRPRHRQGPGRRLARVPEELPDDDLRLLRHAHGRARRARLQGAHEADRRPRACPRDLGDGEHAGPQGPRRRHDAVLDEGQEHEAVGRDGLPGRARAGVPRLAGGDGADSEGSALHHVRLLRLRVQLDGVRPRVLRPRGPREGLSLRRRPARPVRGRAARALQRRARNLGLHPLLLLQRALSEGGRSARRDRQARRRVDPAEHRPGHGREARALVRPLGEVDRLAPRDRARAEDPGHHRGAQGDQVRGQPLQERQGAVDPARGRGRSGGAGALRGREGAGPRRRSRHRPGGARPRRLEHGGEIPPEAAE